MREAWVLAGFLPETPAEEERLELERRSLGFYPNREPHLLDAKDDCAPKAAKRVLAELTAGSDDREERCWAEPPIGELLVRGAGAGLKDFIEQVQMHLIPSVR